MWKKRLGYGTFLLTFGILVFLFNKPFLLGIATIFLLAGILSGIFLWIDAKRLDVEMNVSRGSREGKEAQITFIVHRKVAAFGAASLYAEVEMNNKMFGHVDYRRFSIQMKRREDSYQAVLSADRCGEISIRCEKLFARDVLGLFQIQIPNPRECHMVIYPRQVNVQVALSKASIGSPKDDGIMQNRKGNDPSEMFDLREYTPGDDIRSIHWKLSSKTDSLVLRQASEPAHYNVILLPDFGLEELEDETDVEKVNFMVATGAAVCEQLIRQGVEFCVAIPTNAGLRLYEIRSQKDYRRMLHQWLSFKIQERPGDGLQLFFSSHMQDSFTRMLILTVKNYDRNISRLEGSISTTILGVTDSGQQVHANISSNCDVVEFPMKRNTAEAYRIRC